MAKRRIRFELGEIKISGLKIEIDDELDGANAAFGAAQQLIAGAIQPAFAQAFVKAQGTQGKVLEGSVIPESEAPKLTARNGGKTKGRTRTTTSGETSAAPAFTHKPDLHGSPKQDWTVAQKALWILWAVEEDSGVSELTSTNIVNIFNKHFKTFRTIGQPNVARDLDKQRQKNPPTVGWNPDTKLWHLLEAGKTAAKALAHPAVPDAE